MLHAMHDAMIESLKNLKASEEVIGAYRKRWDETLTGRAKEFPCPACFVAGKRNSALRAQPARDSTHYVKCETCNALYGYVEEDF